VKAQIPKPGCRVSADKHGEAARCDPVGSWRDTDDAAGEGIGYSRRHAADQHAGNSRGRGDRPARMGFGAIRQGAQGRVSDPESWTCRHH
jgi:hypothetical protein